MHTGTLDLNLLMAFQAIYLERNVTKAAERMHMTQSGMSHALGRLRQMFADELFVRSGGAMQPTPRAEELFDAIQAIVNAIETKVLPASQFVPATARREFKLAMSDMGEVVTLASLVSALRAHAPACTLHSTHLKNADIAHALESGQVELALGNVYQPQHNVYQQTVYTHDYRVLAGAGHPRLAAGTLTLSQYLDEDHLVAQSGSDEHLKANVLAPAGWHRRVRATVGGILSIPWMLHDTDMVATVPTHLAVRACQLFPLRSFPLPFAAPPYVIKTCWHPRSQNDPGHQWLRQMAFDVMRRYRKPAVDR